MLSCIDLVALGHVGVHRMRWRPRVAYDINMCSAGDRSNSACGCATWSTLKDALVASFCGGFGGALSALVQALVQGSCLGVTGGDSQIRLHSSRDGLVAAPIALAQAAAQVVEAVLFWGWS